MSKKRYYMNGFEYIYQTYIHVYKFQSQKYRTSRKNSKQKNISVLVGLKLCVPYFSKTEFGHISSNFFLVSNHVKIYEYVPIKTSLEKQFND